MLFCCFRLHQTVDCISDRHLQRLLYNKKQFTSCTHALVPVIVKFSIFQRKTSAGYKYSCDMFILATLLYYVNEVLLSGVDYTRDLLGRLENYLHKWDGGDGRPPSTPLLIVHPLRIMFTWVLWTNTMKHILCISMCTECMCQDIKMVKTALNSLKHFS